MKMRTSTTHIVIHCADTYEDMDIGAEDIRKWHVDERGWSDIGYHKVIRRDGTVEDGRDIDAMGAHVRGFNQTSVGVCLIGTDTFTDEQFESLANLIADLLAKYPSASLRGHRDFPNVKKECPGFDVQKWWSQQTKK